MPVKAIPKLTLARNGVGAFVKPCFRVSIGFCNWGGSSQGVRDLLSHKTATFHKFVADNKDTMFEIQRRNGHPDCTFYYNNGSHETVDVRNMSSAEVTKKLAEFIKRSGNSPFKFNHKVMSNNESVRGIWSPFFTAKKDRHRI